MNYLFICGCPRSGTTALWRMLIAHHRVVLGNERFIFKANNHRFSLRQSLYSKERFFHYQSGDTHFPDLTEGRRGRFYGDMRERFDDSLYVGDKIPKLYLFYRELYKTFPGTRVLFIYRNIFDVANSYKTRLENPDDSWTHDVDEAIDDWNRALEETLAAMSTAPGSVLPIEYERLYSTYDAIDGNLDRILDFLGLQPTRAFSSALRNELTYSARLDESRASRLSNMEKLAIMRRANFAAFNRMSDIANSSATPGSEKSAEALSA